MQKEEIIPYREVTCTDCNGSGKARCMGCTGGMVKMPGLTLGTFTMSVCPTCRGTRYFTCLTCHGTGKRKEYSKADPSDPNDSKEEKTITNINITVLNTSAEAKEKGEISIVQSIALSQWWGEFVRTFDLLPEIRDERINEVIKKGKSDFGDLRAFKSIAAILLGKHDVCNSCDGTGWRECWKCKGSEQLYGSTPPGYIGMPIRSICDSCYGRGGDPCSLCNGTGYI